MNVTVDKRDDGYLIHVETDREIALAVQSSAGERIYLPTTDFSSESHYVEDPVFLSRTENGYAVLHGEEPTNLEII